MGVESWYWLDGGEFHHNRVGPSGIVVDPLGAHDVEMQTVVLLGEGWCGVDLGRVFQNLAVMAKHADLCVGGGLDRLQHELVAFAANPIGLIG